MNLHTSNKLRRSEFDWLRVLAFGMLIFFHTGMLFVSWDWHIKNNELSAGIVWPMIFIGEWRMSLIFLISGVGVFYSLGYRSIKSFTKDRLKRILIPLIAGIFLLVAPQVYFERLTQGSDMDYLEFYLSFLRFEPYPSGNFSWHHLWFLLYLLVYCLILTPILFAMKNSRLDIGNLNRWLILLLPIFWLGTGEWVLAPQFPKTHSLYDDWLSHFMYVSIFLIGFLIAASQKAQGKIKSLRIRALIMAIAITVVLYTFFWVGTLGSEYNNKKVYYYLVAANRWLWILTILGFSLQYLNKPSGHLPTVNQYVYPFYILHQTVIIILGYYFQDVDVSIFLKFTVISLSTFVICYFVVRFLIMKFDILRILFGMKPLKIIEVKNKKQFKTLYHD